MSVNGWKYRLILYQVVLAWGILGMKRLLGNDTRDCHGHLHNWLLIMQSLSYLDLPCQTSCIWLWIFKAVHVISYCHNIGNVNTAGMVYSLPAQWFCDGVKKSSCFHYVNFEILDMKKINQYQKEISGITAASSQTPIIPIKRIVWM